MSWELLTDGSRCLDGLTIAVIAATERDKARCIIRIGRDLAERASLPFDTKSRVDVFIGRGADAGRMRITRGTKRGALPQGKTGAVKICVPPPLGAPPEFQATHVETELDGGLVFSLPWHKRAADREVEEAPPRISMPLAPDKLEPLIWEDEDDEYVDGPPPTLDAIEEAARPIVPEPAPAPRPLARSVTAPERKAKQPISEKELLAGMRRDAPVANQRLVETVRNEVEEIADKPVNGSARQHVYHDSESPERKLLFTHGDKSCRLSQRHYAFAKKLHVAMVKDPAALIDNVTLMEAIGIKEMSILQSTAIAVEDMVRSLGLEIVTIRKTGYRMKEAGA